MAGKMGFVLYCGLTSSIGRGRIQIRILQRASCEAPIHGSSVLANHTKIVNMRHLIHLTSCHINSDFLISLHQLKIRKILTHILFFDIRVIVTLVMFCSLSFQSQT